MTAADLPKNARRLICEDSLIIAPQRRIRFDSLNSVFEMKRAETLATFSAGLEAIRNRQTIRNQWQGTQPHSGGIEDSIRDGRSQPDHGTFTCPRRGKVFAVEQDSLKRGNIAKAWHAIFRHPAVQNLSVLELNRLEECAT